MKKITTFDCMKTIREIRDKLHEKNKNRSRDELISYYAKVKKETLALKENQ